MIVLLVIVGAVALWWFLSQRQLFQLSIRNGEILVVKGRVPIRFLQDVRAVVADERIVSGIVTAVARERGAGLDFSGIAEGPQQRMRNAFRLYPAADIRHAPPIEKPTLGQMLGIGWLAWLMNSWGR